MPRAPEGYSCPNEVSHTRWLIQQKRIGKKSKIKVLAGLVPSEGCDERIYVPDLGKPWRALACI